MLKIYTSDLVKAVREVIFYDGAEIRADRLERDERELGDRPNALFR
jgi:hypothetical protein